jgi:hypothetical protein
MGRKRARDTPQVGSNGGPVRRPADGAVDVSKTIPIAASKTLLRSLRAIASRPFSEEEELLIKYDDLSVELEEVKKGIIWAEPDDCAELLKEIQTLQLNMNMIMLRLEDFKPT